MNKIKTGLLLLIVSIVLISPNVASAHMVGQPPFFKINGTYSNLYPVPTTSLNDFNLPQDLAAENYLVGQNLDLEIDKAQLPVLPEVVNQTKFTWDYGDGEKGEGLKNTHIYKSMGSFFLVIYAQYQNEQAQIIQSTLINVLPDKNYKLPQAKILVNGKESKDPLTDIIKIDFRKEVFFDSSQSESGKIVSYTWDFGDGKSSNEPNPKYKYQIEATQLFPVLRIKDTNGFIADSYIEIEDGKSSESVNQISSDATSSFFESFKLPIIVGAIILLVIGVVIFFKKR